MLKCSLLCDAKCMVQIALQGDVAKKYFDKILQWLAEAPDGKFPKVKIEHLQVSMVKAAKGMSLRRLQSTGRTRQWARWAQIHRQTLMKYLDDP